MAKQSKNSRFEMDSVVCEEKGLKGVACKAAVYTVNWFGNKRNSYEGVACEAVVCALH